jgi:hypothetical protein
VKGAAGEQSLSQLEMQWKMAGLQLCILLHGCRLNQKYALERFLKKIFNSCFVPFKGRNARLKIYYSAYNLTISFVMLTSA